MKPLKVFLCHALEDKTQVIDLYHQLKKLGAAPWLDAEEILPGQEWNFEINKALDESDVILLCLSKRSVSKEGYVQREMRIALDRALEMPEGRIFLIPARLEECDLPQRISSYQWVDLFTANGMSKLVKSLNLRASQVDAQPLSESDAAPISKKSAPKQEAKQESGGINIQGNVSGSNIIIGGNNNIVNKG
jgi:hypothetical protein